MEDDKVVKKGRGAASDYTGTQPLPEPPLPNGTLVVHAFDEVDNKRTAISNARVSASLEGGLMTDVVSGLTDGFGIFKKSVMPGRWNVTVQGVGKTNKGVADVASKCETDVNVPLAIGFQLVRGTAVDTEFPQGRFHRAGTIIEATAHHSLSGTTQPFEIAFAISDGEIVDTEETDTSKSIFIDPRTAEGRIDIKSTLSEAGDPATAARLSQETSALVARREPVPVTGSLNVGLRRSASTVTPDLPLWVVIRNSTDGLSFKNYQLFMDVVLCKAPDSQNWTQKYEELKKRRCLPFTDSEAYRLLKVATEAFVMVHCGVDFSKEFSFDSEDLELLVGRTGVEGLGPGRFSRIWKRYLGVVNGTEDPMLPYLALIGRKFPSVGRTASTGASNVEAELCEGLVNRKLTAPCLLELIWSYWHEEAMLVQTLNAVSVRFQNRRSGSNGDPLANMEIDPLRPLNNLLWGYIQDEQHRLTVVRRGYEYDHQYGLRLQGRAIGAMRTADSRSQFLRAFHHLLHLSSVFFQQDDDTTVISDGFPVLNALKEVHLILSQGAHNQFGDLPATGRIEMLMQQWLLARPEFREFLPTRAMVAYPEPWMDRVDAMKKLQGWSDVNVLHFRDLGVFGEKLLLSIRYGAWVDVHDPDQARNWLRYWRPEIQGYIHAYRAVTGVDVSAEPVNSTLPSVLLQERLSRQQPPRARA